MAELTGKVAIVTGASQGIGAGIAKHLAAAGASVAINHVSSSEAADKVVAEITAKEAIAVHGDVARKLTSKRFSKRLARFGRLDILVNNAGVYKFDPLEDVTKDEFEPTERFKAYALSQTPLGRLGHPDDIGKLAVFLASDQSAWITGESIAASGGLRA
jgi:NAD(P)-dependent dehydrogenase (short-subunit alcohol dehydrogenase family)